MLLPSATSTHNRALYRRLLGYVKPYWKAYGLAIFGMVLTAASESVFPALMKYLLDSGFKTSDPQQVILIPVGLVVLFMFRGVVVFVTGYLMTWITTNVTMTLRNQMFGKALTLPASAFSDKEGNLLSKIVFDVSNMADSASSALISAVRESLTIIGLLTYLIYLDWKLTLITLSVAPIIIGSVSAFSKRMRAASRMTFDSMGQMTHIIEEVTAGQKVIKIFGGQAYEQRRFDATNDYFRHAQLREAIPASATTPITHVAAAIAVAIIVYLALSASPESGANTVGGFISFLTAMLMLLAPVKKLTEVNSSIQRGLAASESVFALLDRPGEPDPGTHDFGRVRGDVAFEHVRFRYPEAPTDALQRIDLSVQAGQTIALVGASGSGKSTLASLLPRFYAPTEGRILIDGVDIQDATLASLRSNIALVSQDVVLFNDSIAANIAYGSASEVSRETIEAAARAANAWEFIQKLPEGLNASVGNNGLKLSGGQRQRIAIARAILKDAPILILDEATSALDNESERLVQAALSELMKGRTTFVVAHRLSTIEGADRILVMDHGRIVESGTHAELLAQGGTYANLYRLQFQETQDETPAATEEHKA